MKLTSAALSLTGVLSGPSLLVAAQKSDEKDSDECVAGAFAFEFSGACTAATVADAYDDQVFGLPGATSRDCASDAAADLNAKLAAAGLTDLDGLCDAVYASQDQVPFTAAAGRGTDLQKFEKMFFDGRTDWQEEVETLYETDDGTHTSRLREDAAAVKNFYRGTAQGRRVAWPGSLSNFQSSATDADGLPTCTTNAAMCCWPKDRQANDNNGNCATPYDTNCVDKDVADNTNLCYVDPARGNQSTEIDNPDGILVYPGDNNDGEGAIHCHGLAWSNDVNDHTARYKANNLFFVSMYDHMHQRGYVQNVPGAPMCGCVEQMPTVSRSDCTQVDLTETVKVTYDPEADPKFSSQLTYVEVDFNACRGINNRNNDLWAYLARLYYQGDVTPEQFGEAGRIITDNGCSEATKYQLNALDLTTGYDHDVSTWTHVAGRDSLRRRGHHGLRAFAATLTADADAGHYGILYRACATCIRTHQKIFYRRRTPVPAGFNLLDNILYRNNNGGGHNKWEEDFSLHSTYEDAVADANPWKCPSNSFDYNYNFYGRCSPDGTRRSSERSRFDRSGDRRDVAYFANQAEDDGLEEVPTVAIKGREYARGAAFRDPADGTIYMSGAGRDIWWYRDDCNFMGEDADGDRDVVVHAGSFAHPQPYQWSKAGIMYRAGPEPGAPVYTVLLTGSRGICAMARLSPGAHMSSGGSCVRSGATEAWLKVTKRADTFTSYVGTETDGGAVEWTVLNTRQVPAVDASGADPYQVGLAVASVRYYAMEVKFQDYQVDSYYFPSAAPSVSSWPTLANPGSVVGSDAVATQSCTRYGGVASRAIDGGTSTSWNGSSVTHTCNMNEPWLQVDLARDETRITHVTVRSRTDCCQWRLRNTDLEILDADGAVVAREPFVGDKDVHEFKFGYLVGRYVRVQKKDYGALNIAEVEVLGSYVAPSAAPSTTSAPTVAEPKSVITDQAVATQVSKCYGGSASRAIDGNTEGRWWKGSVMHTCNNASPWWQVDLGRDGVVITHVYVYNRTDCCKNRLRNTKLEILDAKGAVVASRPFQGDKNVYEFNFGGKGAVGRTVRVNKSEYGVINIAEVQVFGY